MINTRVLFGLSGILILAALWLAVVYLPTNEPLVLHFDEFKGIDRWGEASHVYWLIGLVTTMNLVNLAIVAVFHGRETGISKAVLMRTIGAASALLSLLLLIAVGVIISVN